MEQDASDIHFQPKKNVVRIQFRVRGDIQQHDEISQQLYLRILSHFKFQANMDIGEKRRPQNGSLSRTFKNRQLNVRLSTLPTPYSESLVLRLLPQENNTNFPDLFLFPHSAFPLTAFILQNAGCLIITGPTGCGKTTTIYSLLQVAIAKSNRRVITIEDPVEKVNDAFIQMEVNEKAGLTFAEGFKASLRHDPDIIMIGEIRDVETAKIAINAALSGHLIITTMHAKNTLGALYRLIEFGIPISDLKQTITAIATQTLVNTICQSCGSDCDPPCADNDDKRRLALIELLSDEDLNATLNFIQNKTISVPNYRTLEDEINKAIRLGFLPKTFNKVWIDSS